jgi:hypothetical protein
VLPAPPTREPTVLGTGNPTFVDGTARPTAAGDTRAPTIAPTTNIVVATTIPTTRSSQQPVAATSAVPSIAPAANAVMPTTGTPTAARATGTPTTVNINGTTVRPTTVVVVTTERPVTASTVNPAVDSEFPSFWPSSISTVDKNTVRVTPFRIEYDLTVDTIPDEFQFNFGSDITMVHLEEFIRSQFDTRFGVVINAFEFRLLETGVDPITMDFTIDIVFDQTSAFIPSKQEADILVELAFLEPNKDKLLQSLRTYQQFDLPFGFIDDVFYEPLFDVVVDDDIKSLERDDDVDEWTPAYIGIVSGSIVLALMALTVLVSRRRRRRRFPMDTKLYGNAGSPPTVQPPSEVDYTEAVDEPEEESSSGWESEVGVSSSSEENSSLLQSEASYETSVTSSGPSTYDGSSTRVSSIRSFISIEKSGVT